MGPLKNSLYDLYWKLLTLLCQRNVNFVAKQTRLLIMKTECDKFFFTHPRHKFVFQETKKGSLEISPRFPLQTRQTKETELNEFGPASIRYFQRMENIASVGMEIEIGSTILCVLATVKGFVDIVRLVNKTKR